jgi:hypothetical protein
MKTKSPRLAPMAVEILLCWGSAQEIVTNSGTTREVSKEVLLLKNNHELHELARMHFL